MKRTLQVFGIVAGCVILLWGIGVAIANFYEPQTETEDCVKIECDPRENIYLSMMVMVNEHCREQLNECFAICADNICHHPFERKVGDCFVSTTIPPECPEGEWAGYPVCYCEEV